MAPKMDPRGSKMVSRGLKIVLGAFKIGQNRQWSVQNQSLVVLLLSKIDFVKVPHPFLLIFCDFGLPFGVHFGAEIDEKIHTFFDAFFCTLSGPLVVDFLPFFGSFGRSKSASKSFAMRSCEKRKNLQKCCRVASKSRFADSEVDAKMTLRSMLRPAENTCCTYRRKSQISGRFCVDF